jgi:hypothetical protein
MGVSPSKKAKNDPIDVDDFDFDDGEVNKDFEEDTHDLKDSCLKAVKHEITTGMKPSKFKSYYKVTEKQEPEEPPKWFHAYAARIEKQLEELKEVKNEKEQPNKDIQPEEKDEIDA